MGFLSTYLSFLRRKGTERQEISELRQTILDRLLYIFSIIGLPAAVIGVVQTGLQGRWVFSFLYGGIYLLFLLATFASRRFPYSARGMVLVVALFLISLAVLIRIGMSGVGPLIMVGVCFMAAVFFGLRGGLAAIAVSLLTIGIAAAGMTTGFIEIYPQHMMTSISVMAWSTLLFVFFMVVSVTIIAPEMFQRSIEKSLDLLEEHKVKLEINNQQLREEIKEREWVEQALRKSEKMYRSVIENIQDVFYRSDDQGRLLMGSPSGARMFGFGSVDEMIGIPLDRFWPDPRRRQDLLDHIRKDGSAQDFEAVLKRKDGSVFNASFTTHYYYDDDGNILGTEGIIRDITKRKQAEEEISLRTRQLLESQEKYRELVENISDAIYVVNEDGNISYISPAIEKMAGYRPQDVMGRDFRAFFHPDDIDRLTQESCGFLSGERQQGEFLLLRKSGKPMWVRASSRPIWQENRVVGIQGILTDITDKKKTEAQLKSKARELEILNRLGRQMGQKLSFEAVVNRLLRVTMQSLQPDLAMLFLREKDDLLLKGFLPQQGKWGEEEVTVHRVGECLCGIATREGQTVYSIDIHTDPRCTYDECKAAGLHSFAALPLKIGEEVLGILGMGSREERDFRTSGPFLDALGHEIAIGLKNTLLYERAQSDAVELQTRLVQIQEAQKEKEALMRQLHRAQKMEAIGTLAGGIAHDFNNILTPIVMGTEFVLMNLPGETKSHVMLNRVLDAGTRAKDLVNQILTFSRQDDLEKCPLRLGPILKETVKLMRAALPSTIDVQFNICKEQDTVLANPTQMHQLIMNLVSNAGHAMRAKGGILNISLTEATLDEATAANIALSLAPGPYLKLVVTDTGHGMDSGTLEKIFEPFFTTKSRGEGTGLGLATVHGIVSASDGVVQVESEVGKGSSFTIYLPRLRSRNVKTQRRTEAIPQGTENILFVDDEPMIADMYSDMLHSLGYAVDCRTDPLDTLEAFKSNPDKYDMVITDMTMPGMTGRELGIEIMRIRPNVPVILCTGFSERMPEEKALKLGFCAFVMKPVVIGDIAQKIRSALDGSPLEGRRPHPKQGIEST